MLRFDTSVTRNRFSTIYLLPLVHNKSANRDS